MATVTLDSVRKSFGDREVVHGVSCAVGDGELVVVVGPSGCGKSTLLRMVAGLEAVSAGSVAIDGRVARAAEILQLDGLLQRKPRQLSGGQRQRVAMGRAIVRDPKVFLFDEPLSNLDAQLRVQM